MVSVTPCKLFIHSSTSTRITLSASLILISLLHSLGVDLCALLHEMRLRLFSSTCSSSQISFALVLCRQKFDPRHSLFWPRTIFRQKETIWKTCEENIAVILFLFVSDWGPLCFLLLFFLCGWLVFRIIFLCFVLGFAELCFVLVVYLFFGQQQNTNQNCFVYTD